MGTLQGWGQKACDEVYRKKRGRRSKGDTWWFNEEVKQAGSRKKDRRQCIKTVLRRIRRYKSMKNKANKSVSRAMRDIHRITNLTKWDA